MKKNEKQFETLDDIDKALETRAAGRRRSKAAGGGRHKSRARKGFLRGGGNGGTDFRGLLDTYGRFLLIPAVCLLLLFGIRLAGGRSGEAEQTAETEPVAALAATPSTVSETAAELRLSEIPEIRMLVDSYFQARLAADVDTLYTLFGRSGDAGKTDTEAKLKAQASWIQTFDDIQIYELPGLESDARLCIVTYSINFRRTDTLAPGIMYCYIQKDAGGNYIFADTLMKDRIDYINEQLAREDVSTLMQETDNALSNALASDSTLALIYTSFVNGEIYKESNLDTERDQEVDLFLNAEDSDLAGGLQDAIDQAGLLDENADNADAGADMPADAADDSETGAEISSERAAEASGDGADPVNTDGNADSAAADAQQEISITINQ